VSDRHDDLIARAIRRAADGVAPITLAEVAARGPVPDAVDGEPVTDAPVLAHGRTSTGGPVMVIDLEHEHETGAAGAPPARRRSRWPVAAAAAALLAVVVAVGFAAAGSDERVEVAPAEDPSSQDPSTEGTALVDGFIDVYNTGDPAAVADRFAPDPGSPLDATKHVDPAYQAADDRWTRTGPCRLEGADAVVCPIRRVDAFHGAAGLSIEEDYVFRFDGAGLLERLVLLESDPWADHHAFRADFRAWATEQHPEVEIRWFPPAGSYSDELADMPTAEGMPAALGLVEEFVAQSDRWGS
jgi:hypothetical protein